MKSAIVKANELGDRWDPKFHVLREEHKAAYQELRNNFTIHELVQLAKDLPFDQEAADAVFPTVTKMNVSKLHELLDNTLKPKTEEVWDGDQRKFVTRELPLFVPQQRWRNICVYVAAAACGSFNKAMEDVLALRQQELERIKQASAVMQAVLDKGCPNLKASMRI